jgi:hypothetical protein
MVTKETEVRKSILIYDKAYFISVHFFGLLFKYEDITLMFAGVRISTSYL